MYVQEQADPGLERSDLATLTITATSLSQGSDQKPTLPGFASTGHVAGCDNLKHRIMDWYCLRVGVASQILAG